MITKIFTLFFALFSGFVLAAGSAHDHLPPASEKLTQIEGVKAEGVATVIENVFGWLPFPVTNSMVMTIIAGAVLILLFRLAASNLKAIPSGAQNFGEFVAGSLYDFLETIMGKHLTKRTFWFLGSVFFLILISNWLGLVPGVGTIGLQAKEAASELVVDYPGASHDNFRPFLRGANADQNVTFAMSITFMLLWLYWSFTEVGFKGFLEHIFAPKGKFSGFMLVFMWLIFMIVGVIEVVSISIRPLTLALRLYGNIYAGENLLETLLIGGGDNFFLRVLGPMPFYFMELMVGMIQAFVFTLLCAIFIKLMCEHHDDEHEEAHH